MGFWWNKSGFYRIRALLLVGIAIIDIVDVARVAVIAVVTAAYCRSFQLIVMLCLLRSSNHSPIAIRSLPPVCPWLFETV